MVQGEAAPPKQAAATTVDATRNRCGHRHCHCRGRHRRRRLRCRRRHRSEHPGRQQGQEAGSGCRPGLCVPPGAPPVLQGALLGCGRSPHPAACVPAAPPAYCGTVSTVRSVRPARRFAASRARVAACLASVRSRKDCTAASRRRRQHAASAVRSEALSWRTPRCAEATCSSVTRWTTSLESTVAKRLPAALGSSTTCSLTIVDRSKRTLSRHGSLDCRTQGSK